MTILDEIFDPEISFSTIVEKRTGKKAENILKPGVDIEFETVEDAISKIKRDFVFRRKSHKIFDEVLSGYWEAVGERNYAKVASKMHHLGKAIHLYYESTVVPNAILKALGVEFNIKLKNTESDYVKKALKGNWRGEIAKIKNRMFSLDPLMHPKGGSRDMEGIFGAKVLGALFREARDKLMLTIRGSIMPDLQMHPLNALRAHTPGPVGIEQKPPHLSIKTWNNIDALEDWMQQVGLGPLDTISGPVSDAEKILTRQTTIKKALGLPKDAKRHEVLYALGLGIPDEEMPIVLASEAGGGKINPETGEITDETEEVGHYTYPSGAWIPGAEKESEWSAFERRRLEKVSSAKVAFLTEFSSLMSNKNLPWKDWQKHNLALTMAIRSVTLDPKAATAPSVPSLPKGRRFNRGLVDALRDLDGVYRYVKDAEDWEFLIDGTDLPQEYKTAIQSS